MPKELARNVKVHMFRFGEDILSTDETRRNIILFFLKILPNLSRVH